MHSFAVRSALVLYGSETGNAQDAAEELGQLCERLRFATKVAELDSITLKQLLHSSLVLFVISTTGQGELPSNSRRFWRLLRSAKLPQGCLHNVKFTSFGLGDSSYPQFNWAHRKLSNRLLQLGAQVVCERAESDEQHPEGIDGALLPWLAKLRDALLHQYPLPPGEQPIPEEMQLEPRWTLQLAPQPTCETTETSKNVNDASDRHALQEMPPDGLLPVPNGLAATVERNERVTAASHWQDVRHMSLSLDEQHDYAPGDVLAIYPKNFPPDVEQLIQLEGWSAFADLPLTFEPTDEMAYGQDAASYPPAPVPVLVGRTFTLRALITNHIDLMSIPRRSFFSHLIHYTEDEFHLQRLKEFTNPELIDERFDYTTRPRRSILEVLDEFTSVKLPWQRLCSIVPVMRSRQFSICSGGSLKISAADPSRTTIELLVAIVKYRTVIKRIRQGVCTRYMASLRTGQQITVTLHKGGLNLKESDMQKPVIMIGPGTGVAPMRSLIYERLKWREDHGIPAAGVEEGNEVLFFGCRSSKADYFFSEEWAGLPHLAVYPAFSRDQREKIYVQDLVRRESRKVYIALAEKGGMVFVCGSSGKMPQAVRESLIGAFEKEGGMAREDARGFLERMEREGRYKQETW